MIGLTMFCFLKFLLYLISGAAVLTVGLVIYLIWFQKPFYFPKPTGQYAVGIKKYHWIDKSRKETLSDDPAHPNRELMVNIWYPAQGKLPEKLSTPYAPYLVDYFKKNHNLNLFSSLFHRRVYTYAQPESSNASEMQRYPIIIFSHGSEVTRDHNTAQCEELASHGYVVVGISHTYNSGVVQFPDGRIIDGAKVMRERCKNKNLVQILQQFDQDVETWISDVGFVLDELEQLVTCKESIFYQRLDQKNIGIFGHSVGGGTAAQICRRDSRVKVGVALDGFLLGVDADKKFDKPFMFMLAGDRAKTFERPWTKDDWKKFDIVSQSDEKAFKSYYLPAIQRLAQSIGRDVYTFDVETAGHLDFCDIAFLMNASHFWRNMMLTGVADGAFCTESIDGFRATEIVNAYLVNFFDKYLKGQPSELLDGDDKRYEEVVVKKWRK